MEQIHSQIDRSLKLLALAKPTAGLWTGVAAATLTSSLAALESELIYLKLSLNW